MVPKHAAPSSRQAASLPVKRRNSPKIRMRADQLQSAAARRQCSIGFGALLQVNPLISDEDELVSGTRPWGPVTRRLRSEAFSSRGTELIPHAPAYANEARAGCDRTAGFCLERRIFAQEGVLASSGQGFDSSGVACVGFFLLAARKAKKICPLLCCLSQKTFSGRIIRKPPVRGAAHLQ